MTTALGPPAVAPTSVRGALATLPTFLRRNAVTVLVSAAVAGVFGWVVNVWMLAVKFEGNNDVPVGSPVTGQNNTRWAVMFWVLCSMVVCGAVGYARAAGVRRFLYDVRTTPRVLVGLARREGASARIHLLWGAGLALAIGLLVPPAVGAVVSIGVLAALPTVIGAVAGSLLGRMSSAVMKPLRPGAPPLGMEAMVVGLTGAGVALFVGFVVPNAAVRGVLAGACILAAIVLGRHPGAAAHPALPSVVAVVGLAAWLAHRLLAVRHAFADDGGFAECGYDLGTWWRQCEGAGEVRRQAVPGGIASAVGAPIGVFLGSWAGSVARLRPLLFGHGSPPPADPVSLWQHRDTPWAPHTEVRVSLDGGAALRCTMSPHGATTPWVGSAGSQQATELAARLDTLAHDAPSPAHADVVHRLFQDAAHRPDLLDRIAALERQHHDVWRDRLEAAQRDLYEQVHGRTTFPAADAGKGLAAAGVAEEASRFPAFDHHAVTSAHHATAARASAGGTVHQLETLQLGLRRWGDAHAPLDGYHTTVTAAERGLVPLAGGDLAASSGAPARPFTGEHDATLDGIWSALPHPGVPRVAHLPDATTVTHDTTLGPVPDLAGHGLAARTQTPAVDHADRLAAALRPGGDPALAELQRLQAELWRHRAVHGVPLEGGEPWYAAQLDALSARAELVAAQRWQTELQAVQRQLQTMASIRHEAAAMDRMVEMRQTLEAVAYGRMTVAEGDAAAMHRFGTGLAGLAAQAQLAVVTQAAATAGSEVSEDG